MSYDGTTKWDKQLQCGLKACIIGSSGNEYLGSFKPQVFVGELGKNIEDVNGRILCLNGDDGSDIWNFNLEHDPDHRWSCVGLAIGDLDWNGDLELIAVTKAMGEPEDGHGELLRFDAKWGDTLWTDNSRQFIYGLGTIPPALGDLNGDQYLEIVSGGNRSTTNFGEDAIYCWDHSGSLLWSVGERIHAGLFGSLTSVVLASFSTTEIPVYCVLLNARNQQTNPQSSLWLLDAGNGNRIPGYPQLICGEALSTPGLKGCNISNNMDFTVGSSQNDGTDDRRVYAFDADVLNDSANIEWGMYYHDPKHTGRHSQPVSGTVDSDVAWYGRYILWGNIIIDAGHTLRIEPGTRIEAKDGFGIYVNGGGHLIIGGSEQYPVTLTSYSDSPSPGIWRGIHLYQNADLEMKHCKVEYAFDGVYMAPNVNFDIDYSTFSDCSNSGFYASGGGGAVAHSITNSVFEDCGNFGVFFNEGNPIFAYNSVAGAVDYGLKYSGSGAPQILNSSFSSSKATSYWGIYVKSNLPSAPPSPILMADSVTRFGQGGINITDIQNNGVVGSRVKAIDTGNYGLYLKGSSPSVIGNSADDHNTFIDNYYGIYCDKYSGGVFRWNNVKRNTVCAFVQLNAFPDFGTNLSWGNNSFERALGASYEMINNNLTSINARYNWWGTDGPQVYGPVNTFPTLGYDPIPGYGKRSVGNDVRPIDFSASNYPNPFNSETKIAFYIAKSDRVSIEIFDIGGRSIRNLVDQDLNSGEHYAVWDGRSSSGNQVSSGIYFYSIKTSGTTISRKMILLK